MSASEKLIGQKTSDNLEIKQISIHFVSRLFGDYNNHKVPVNLTKAISAILYGEGKPSSTAETCRVYKKDNISVVFNYKTGKVVQCQYSSK